MTHQEVNALWAEAVTRAAGQHDLALNMGDEMSNAPNFYIVADVLEAQAREALHIAKVLRSMGDRMSADDIKAHVGREAVQEHLHAEREA